MELLRRLLLSLFRQGCPCSCYISNIEWGTFSSACGWNCHYRQSRSSFPHPPQYPPNTACTWGHTPHHHPRIFQKHHLPWSSLLQQSQWKESPPCNKDIHHWTSTTLWRIIGCRTCGGSLERRGWSRARSDKRRIFRCSDVSMKVLGVLEASLLEVCLGCCWSVFAFFWLDLRFCYCNVCKGIYMNFRINTFGLWFVYFTRLSVFILIF